MLGTMVEIEASGSSALTTHRAIDQAFAAIARVHSLMSFHDPHSELSRINCAPIGQDVFIHSWTAAVIGFSLELHEVSNGFFDPGIAPVLMRSGLLPSNQHDPVTKSSISNLHLSPAPLPSSAPTDSYRVHKSGNCCIDLGGCAKGFAVDCAIDALVDAGVSSGIVNAGGDLRCFGSEEFPVLIRSANIPGAFEGYVKLKSQALATSALTFMAPQSPIIDPISQSALNFEKSVSVIAPTALVADSLTKVVLTKPSAAPAILGSYNAALCQPRDIASLESNDRALGKEFQHEAL